MQEEVDLFINHNADEPELWVFDICDTLFYSNTTFDFIKFVLKEKKSSFKLIIFYLLTIRYSPIFLLFYLLQKVKKTDLTKKAVLYLLSGMPKAKLNNLGKKFERQFLSMKVIDQTHKLFNHLQLTRKKIILISASIDPVVSAIASVLKVNYRSSTLEYDSNDIFTGKLNQEMAGKKLDELSKLLSGKDSKFAMITDNFSDRNIIQAAHQKFVIVYNQKAQEYWKDLDPNFIKLF